MRLLRRFIPVLCLTLPSLGRAQSTIAVAAGTSTKIQVAPGVKFSVPLLMTVPTAGATSVTSSVVAVSSIAAQLNWNAAGMTIDSITTGNFGTVSATILSPSIGRAVLSVFSASSASGTVTLAYAWFTASASVAGTQLHLDVSEASNAQGAVLATPTSSTGTDVCVAPMGKWGDVNGDSLVNILDAQQIARFAVGMPVADQNTFQSTGDVTGDNAINVIDAQQVARFAIGLSAPSRTATSTFVVPPIASVAVGPSAGLSVGVGSGGHVFADARSASGAPLAGCRGVSWTSSDTTKVRVTATGDVTGVATGSATITAAVGGQSASVAVTVGVGTSGQAMAIERVRGNNQFTIVGGTVPETPVVRIKDSFGTPISDAHVSWSVPAGAPVFSANNQPTVVSVTDSLGYTALPSKWTAPSSGSNATLTVQSESGASTTFTATLMDNASVGEHSCMVVGTGAYCWGAGARGQLGNGGTTGTSVPVAVGDGFALARLSENIRGDHSCGVTTSGQGVCWGYNAAGQLGDSSRVNRATPVLVKSSVTWSKISVGAMHTCGLSTAGAAYCWGINRFGEIGDSTIGTSYTTPVAVRMPTGVTFVDIGAGANTTCAAASTGDVYCWGASGGSVFSSATGIQRLPTKVAGASGVVRISVGTLQACALTSAGAAYCLGYASMLGNGTVSTSSMTPVAVSGGHVFTEIVAGDDKTCALKADGSVWCWGYDFAGQLGDGATVEVRATPVPVPMAATRLMAGGAGNTAGDHTCALAVGGAAVFCWGRNSSGQIGDGTATFATTPVSVILPTAAAGSAASMVPTPVSFSSTGSAGATLAPTFSPSVIVRDGRGGGVAGVTVTFAVVSGGGSLASTTATTNSAGQATAGQWTLGAASGMNVVRATATLAGGATSNTFFYSFGTSAVATLTKVGGDSVVFSNQTTAPPYNAPTVRVLNANGQPQAGVTVTFSGLSTTVTAKSDSAGIAQIDRAALVGVTSTTTITASVSGATAATFTFLGLPNPSLSRNSPCALATGGIAYCWGLNSFGALGDGTTTQRNYAAPVSGSQTFTRLSDQQATHHCALTAAGAAWCWGDNRVGQLGDGTTTQRTVPTAVTGGLAFKQIVTENLTTCGLTTAGSIYCWGWMQPYGLTYPALAERSQLTPVPLNSNGLSFAEIALWDTGLCGRTAAGSVYCLGDNSAGAVGDGTFTDRSTFTAVTGGVTFTHIAGGTSNICGVASTGALLCWGSGQVGNNGDGTTQSRNVPTPIALAEDRFRDVIIGNLSPCGLRIDGRIFCWGGNSFAMAGTGDVSGASLLTPQEITGAVFTELTATSFRGKCARVVSGSMYCWGSNSNGQVGDSSTVSLRGTPVAVVGWPSSLTAGTPTTITPTSAWVSGRTAAIGAATSVPPQVVVKDKSGKAVVGVTVTFTVTSGTGTLGGAVATTDSTGTASAQSFVLGNSGFASISAKTDGLPPTVLVVTTAASAPASSAISFGDQQAQVAGSVTQGYLGVIVKDVGGNPVSNTTVQFTFAAGSGGGVALSPTGTPTSAVSTTTDATGIARAVFTPASGTVGTQSITANVVGTSIPPVTFSVLTVAAQNNQGDARCQLTTSGAAYCWGDNRRGQIGDGTTVSRTMPTAVVGGITFASLARGSADHMCGLTAAGAAYCWGSNSFGELGDGTTTDRSTPVAVAGGNSFTSLAVSLRSTCGVTAAGGVLCWGSMDQSVLGDGSYGTINKAPAAVNTGGVAFASVSMGTNVTCGITTSGTIYCWGSFTGDGTTGGSFPASAFSTRPFPAAINDGRTYTSVSVGTQYACAVTTTNEVYCWGRQASGQLGDGSTTVQRTSPTRVASSQSFASVSVGLTHACALTVAGSSWCWGYNGDQSAGDSTTANRSVPTATLGGLTFSRIAALGSGTCARTSAGALYCWGAGGLGQNGDSTTSPRGTPAAVKWVEGTARALAITTQPSGGVSLNAWGTQIVVAVKDGVGTTVTGATNAVSLALVGGTGAVLTCTANPVAAVNGVATFSGCAVDKAGTYTLSATSTGLGSATSNSFSITPGAASLATSTITASPTSITANGSATSTLTVQLKDASGNNLTASGGTVTIVQTNGPSLTLSAVTDNNNGSYTATVKGSVAGTATFSASLGSSTLTSGSVSVTLTPGAATQISIYAGNNQSATVGTAVGTVPTVLVLDANSNKVSGVSVTFAVASGGGSGTTLTTATNSNGVASPGSWTLGTTAGVNTMTATATGLTGSPLTFSDTAKAGATTQIAISTAASGAPAGSAFTTQPSIEVKDTYGNLTSQGTVRMTVSGGDGQATVRGDTIRAASNGYANFTNVGIAGTAETSYTLTFTSGSYTVTQSITATTGPAAKLAFSQQASGVNLGANFTIQPFIDVQDAGSNFLTGATGYVTISINNGASFYGSPVKTVAVTSGGVAFTGIGLASGTPPGTYTLSYTWTDSLGNPTGSIPVLTQTITVP